MVGAIFPAADGDLRRVVCSTVWRKDCQQVGWFPKFRQNGVLQGRNYLELGPGNAHLCHSLFLAHLPQSPV